MATEVDYEEALCRAYCCSCGERLCDHSYARRYDTEVRDVPSRGGGARGK